MRNWICCALTLSQLYCVPPSLADDASSNPVTDAWIPWGETTCVSNEDVLFSPWPDWMVSAFKIGGTWDTNVPAWVVEAGDTNEASLNIEVNRFRLTNNVLMKLDYVDHSNATMMLDLYAFPGTNEPNEPVFTSNLFNNLLSGNGGVTSRTFTIPVLATAVGSAMGLRAIEAPPATVNMPATARLNQIQTNYQPDNWRGKELRPGDIVYGATPGPSSFFVDARSARRLITGGGSAVGYHQFTQSRINPRFGPRNALQAYIVIKPTRVATGEAVANRTIVQEKGMEYLGEGGANQLFIDDWKEALKPVEGISWPLLGVAKELYFPMVVNE